MTFLDELAQDIHDNAASKGFWNKERNMGEMLMLMVSELAEALEEHREGNPAFYLKHRTRPDVYDFTSTPEEYLNWIPLEQADWKPEGVAVEIADAIIRELDTMHSLKISADAVIAAKMAYNTTREAMHGKAY